MKDKILQIEQEAREALSRIDSAQAAEAFRIAYLGKKGKLTELFKGLGAVPPEEKKSVGAELNRVKVWLETAVDASRVKTAHISAAAEVFDRSEGVV